MEGEKMVSVIQAVALHIEKNGIKQIFLAEKTNIEKDKISAILNMRRKCTADELILICKALKVDPIELYEKANSDRASA